MTEKPNKPFIERLAKIYRENYVEPDWKKILNIKDKEEKTLQQKAIEASNKRSEIAGTHNTEWMPLNKEDKDE